MHPDRDEPTRADYAVKEARKSKLPLSEQDKCIAELQEVTNLLLDRLDPVLTPQPETPAKDGSEPDGPMISQIGHELEGNNARIRRVTNRLSNALQRLEV